MIFEKLPKECECRHISSMKNMKRNRRVQSKYRLENVHVRIVEAIRNLTKVDRKLYKIGAEMTLSNIEAVEEMSGKKILCEEKLDKMKDVFKIIEN